MLFFECRWTAPEAVRTNKFTQRTDTWSMGITMYEIWTRASRPYTDMSTQEVGENVNWHMNVETDPSVGVLDSKKADP